MCLDIAMEVIWQGRWRNFYEIFLEAPYFVLKKTRVGIYLSTRH